MSAQESAEALALQALAWLLGQEDERGAFLALSGLAPSDIADNAGDPAFLAAVLDFVLAEDVRVVALAAEAGLAPEAVGRARAHLPGGEAPHWT